MLKKAGIVVAAAAAGLLAVSPLAFAGDKGYDHEDGDSYSYEENFSNNLNDNTFANVSGNNVQVPIQACNNDFPIQGGFAQGQVPVDDLTGAVTGALALFGDPTAESHVTPDNSRSCDDNGETQDAAVGEVG